MPLYHFNVFDGVIGQDLDGTELFDFAEARVEAIGFAGQLISEQAKRIQSGLHWHMEVTDQSGLILLCLDFLITETIAAVAERSRLQRT